MMRGSQQQTTTTVQVASGADRSGLVLVLGLGLIAVNFIFGGLLQVSSSGTSGWQYLTGQTKSPPNLNRVGIALSFLALGLLLLLAKFGGEFGGNLAALFLAAMWVVWLLNEPAAVTTIFTGKPFNSSASSNSSGPSTSGSGGGGGGGKK